MAKHVITPVWQTQRGSVVRASGCAVGVPVAGAKVFGETRQNLWVNPSGTNNGVTVTSNGDGSIMLSGTASAIATIEVRVCNLQLGKSYAFSVDKAIPGVGDGYGFYIDTDAQASYYIGNSSHLNRTYTLDSEATEVTIGVYIPAGTTVSGTYRVMLNEGSTAEPWCPPGLSSVGELSIKAGASEGDPDASTAPIDLSGHQLRSLPDGTRDVLTVDGSGAVSVEQAVMSYTATGEEDVHYVADAHECTFIVSGVGDNVNPESTDTALCDKLPKMATTRDTTGFSFLRNTIYFMVKDVITDTASAKQWLAQNKPTFILPMATSQTLALDPIIPPSIPAADATLWAASDVPCDIEATTWTASGAEQGRQQAAMVKVAQQVRQQAETVAALAAQSLEA